MKNKFVFEIVSKNLLALQYRSQSIILCSKCGCFRESLTHEKITSNYCCCCCSVHNSICESALRDEYGFDIFLLNNHSKWTKRPMSTKIFVHNLWHSIQGIWLVFFFLDWMVSLTLSANRIKSVRNRLDLVWKIEFRCCAL